MTGQDLDESDFSGSPTIFFVRLIYNNYALQLGETHQYGEEALRIMAHYNGGTILALINQTAKRSDAATVRLQKLYCSKSALLALEPTIAKLDLLGDCQNKLMMHGSDVDCQVKNGGATR